MLYFETHATTFDNEAGIASGHNDSDLSAAGLRQASELGTRYAGTVIDLVLCSDLQRSWRTAEVAFETRDIPTIRDARLRECSYGDWDGRSSAVIQAERLARVSIPYPNGESYEDVVSRVRECLLERKRFENILVIGHRATYYSVDHLLTGMPLREVIAADWKWQPGWRFDQWPTKP